MAETPFTYRELRPRALAEHVDFLWYFEGPTVDRRKRILPNGKLELLVNFGEPYQVIQGQGAERITAGCLSGMQAGPIVVEQPARQKVLGVRLHPAGAYALLAAPLQEISGLMVDLDTLFGPSARELVQECGNAASAEQCLTRAALWVHRRIARARPATPEVRWSAACIERAAGRVAIAELRRHVGFSTTRLAAAFRQEVGLRPKLYARVVRFRSVLAVLQRGPAPLAGVAVDAAYYDQPHMIADFRDLGGITPTEFLAARHPVGDGTTVADR